MLNKEHENVSKLAPHFWPASSSHSKPMLQAPNSWVFFRACSTSWAKLMFEWSWDKLTFDSSCDKPIFGRGGLESDSVFSVSSASFDCSVCLACVTCFICWIWRLQKFKISVAKALGSLHLSQGRVDTTPHAESPLSKRIGQNSKQVQEWKSKRNEYG